MTPTIFDAPEALSQAAAQWLAERTRAQPDLLACLAAGGTPSDAYARFVDAGRRERALAAHLRVIQLDEWGGLGAAHPASCQRQLRDQFVTPLELQDRFCAFDGAAADADAECRRVAAWLDQHGPIDACILGLGMNGHLGFNEPAAELAAHAHVVPLSAASQAHAMVSDMAAKPSFGMTLGMADLLRAREILLVVSGARKAAALGRLTGGGIATDFPASLLHLHPRVTLLCDAAAAGVAAAGA